MSAVLMGAVALSVDVGSMFSARRRAQGATDLAALSGALSLSTATAAVQTSLSDNGYGLPDDVVVETGSYSADASVAPGARFRLGMTPSNAVRVRLLTHTPLFFGRALTRTDRLSINTAAIAARSENASFSIGSRLASVQSGLANTLLTALLGSSVTLSAMDYSALASARLDVFQFTQALATQLNLSAMSYNQVLAMQATLPQVLSAAVAAATAGGASFSATNALRQIVTAVQGSLTTVPLAQLFSLGDLGSGLAVGGGTLDPLTVGLLDLVNTVAQIANGGKQIQLDLTPLVPGIVGTKLTLGIGERTQTGAWVGVGPAGTTISTAQTRLLIEAKLTAPLGLGSITLPIYVEAASAQAAMSTLTCPRTDRNQLSATLQVMPTPLKAAIAQVAASSISTAAFPPSLSSAATLVTFPSSLPLVTVQGRSVVETSSSTPQNVVFSADDIATQRVRTVTSAGMTSALAASLVGNLSLNVGVVGLGIGLPSSAIQSAVAATLATAAAPLDAVLDPLLRTFGIGIGQADVWANGVRCGGAVLVQ